MASISHLPSLRDGKTEASKVIGATDPPALLEIVIHSFDYQVRPERSILLLSAGLLVVLYCLQIPMSELEYRSQGLQLELMNSVDCIYLQPQISGLSWLSYLRQQKRRN